MPENSDQKREFLRHTVATLAYRGRKALTGVEPGFATWRPGPASRAPVEILAHIGDLLDWALWLCRGQHVWRESIPLPWDDEVKRLFDALLALDRFLASAEPLGFPAERLFQGPVADALTHIGQISMCRRLAGAPPVRGENYFKAEISAGRVGLEQAPAIREFD
ncbi:MAG: hypothetical protein EHM61_16485 [Acidobacteria bacterium]|nr:MAG: hypothetical protein EHM61_16485 [Acidobacteriota bacterium]